MTETNPDLAQGTRLTTLDPAANPLTIINTHVVAPEQAEALLDYLVQATTVTRQFDGTT